MFIFSAIFTVSITELLIFTVVYEIKIFFYSGSEFKMLFITCLTNTVSFFI